LQDASVLPAPNHAQLFEGNAVFGNPLGNPKINTPDTEFFQPFGLEDNTSIDLLMEWKIDSLFRIGFRMIRA